MATTMYTIKVDRAENLVALDHSGTSDPYVLVHTPHIQFTTSVKPRTLNPEWKEWCQFAAKFGEDVPIKLHVYDSDQYTADDLMGCAEVVVKPGDRATGEEKFDLTLDNADTGVLHIQLKWTPYHSSKSRPKKLGNYVNVDYQAWLSGPELEDLRHHPPQTHPQPFIMRVKILCFGVVMGIIAQASLWRGLAHMPAMSEFNIPTWLNIIFWVAAAIAYAFFFVTYAIKTCMYPWLVNREFRHPVRGNFFALAWGSAEALLLAVPPAWPQPTSAIWVPVAVCLSITEVRLYHHWLRGDSGQNLSEANPSFFLATIGNLLAAGGFAQLGRRTLASAFFLVGILWWALIFASLWPQLRLRSTDGKKSKLQRDMHPMLLLLIAPPSVAANAWAAIQGEYTDVSRFFYFNAIVFTFVLLPLLPSFARSAFSPAWWAYTFPLSAVSSATMRFAATQDDYFPKILALFWAFLAVLVFLVVCYQTWKNWEKVFGQDPLAKVLPGRPPMLDGHPGQGVIEALQSRLKHTPSDVRRMQSPAQEDPITTPDNSDFEIDNPRSVEVLVASDDP